MVILATLWILSSALVGYFGRRRALGFWGVAAFSMLFSPIAGSLALIVCHTPPRPPQRRKVLRSEAAA